MRTARWRKSAMKKLSMVGSMVLVSLVAKTNVQAFDGWRSGAECQPATPADAADLNYSQFGVQNMSTTTSRNVICPIPTIPYGNVNITVGIRAYDRNMLAIGNNNVSCNIYRMGIDGTINFSLNLSTSGGGPGIQALDSTFFTSSWDYMWQFHCSIPKIQSGEYSHLAFYYLQSDY
jgi:hypothetical protein